MEGGNTPNTKIENRAEVLSFPASGAGSLRTDITLLVADILHQDGIINFQKLFCFIESADFGQIDKFFQEQKNIETILFPFFDFLKCELFSEKKPISLKIVEMIKKCPSVRDGMIAYVEQGNTRIMSIRSVEQYNTIAFHLFLLSGGREIDLLQDVRGGKFNNIKSLFSQCWSRANQCIGGLTIQQSSRLPLGLGQELRCYLQIGETVNKLALVYAENFEGHQTSFQLGEIIIDNINSMKDFFSTLEERVWKNQEGKVLQQKLQYLSGRVECNVAHCERVKGDSVSEIRRIIHNMKRRQNDGYARQYDSLFGWDPNEEESSRIILLWNQAIADGIERELVSALPDPMSPPELENLEFLQNFIHVYNFGVDTHCGTADDIIADFTDRGVKNGYQAESVYNSILFDPSVSAASFVKLLQFFMRNDVSAHENLIIKIAAQTIRRLQGFQKDENTISLSEEVCASLEKKNISDSIRSYSKVYLALALYFVDCADKKHNIDLARKCFTHYKNLSAHLLSTEKNPKNLQDEKRFYARVWQLSEIAQYGSCKHTEAETRKGGESIMEDSVKTSQQQAISDIGNLIHRIMSSMKNGENTSESEGFKSDLLEDTIAKTIFYNLCTVKILQVCKNCRNDECDGSFCTASGDVQRPQQHTFWKRWYGMERIQLGGELFITFTYPLASKDTFDKIFSEYHDLIEERLGNLIATYNQTMELKNEKSKVEKLAFLDSVTGLWNRNKLTSNISLLKDEGENAIVFLDVVGRENIIPSFGEDYWSELMEKVATHLQAKSWATVYKYDDSTFCLVYASDRLAADLETSPEERTVEEYVHTLMSDVLAGFYAENGKSTQLYAGIVVWQTKENMINYASIALANAKSCREKRMYVFKTGDEKVLEEMRRYEGILEEALFGNNPSIRLVPYYQYIHRPIPHLVSGPQKFLSDRIPLPVLNPVLNPELPPKSCEALARIRYISESGEVEVIEPGKFIRIAEQKGWLPEVTLLMLSQITDHMSRDPDLHVSVNISQDDWNDRRVTDALLAFPFKDRLILEMLETIQLTRTDDQKRIEALKELGYRFALDDFGVENANMFNFAIVDPYKIKIDGKIISLFEEEQRVRSTIDMSNMGEEEKKAIEEAIKEVVKKGLSIITSILALAKSKNTIITAEFIRSPQLYRLLQALGIREFQGYLFAKPVSFDELDTAIKIARLIGNNSNDILSLIDEEKLSTADTKKILSLWGPTSSNTSDPSCSLRNDDTNLRSTNY